MELILFRYFQNVDTERSVWFNSQENIATVSQVQSHSASHYSSFLHVVFHVLVRNAVFNLVQAQDWACSASIQEATTGNGNCGER